MNGPSVLVYFDAARSVLIRTAMRTPLGDVLKSRNHRATLRATSAILVALFFAWAAPAAALAVSPLVLGVPHIASSIRYLVLRQGFQLRTKVLIVLAALSLLVFRVLEQYGHAVTFAARIEVTIGVAWAFVAAIAGARVANAPKRLFALLPILCGMAVMGLLHPTWMRLAFVHVHNLGAVIVWLILFRRSRAIVPLVLLGGTLLLLTSGALAPLTTTGLGVDLAVVGQWLAPGLAVSAAIPLVLAHVFTDSVHYAFWLGVIPEETLEGQGSLTFNMTWRGLVRDFGPLGLALVFGLMLALGLFACFGAAKARDLYFAVAGFHGYVEGAMLVYLVSSRLAGGASARPRT